MGTADVNEKIRNNASIPDHLGRILTQFPNHKEKEL